MYLPPRVKSLKKNEMKTFPPRFLIFPDHRTDAKFERTVGVLGLEEGKSLYRWLRNSSHADISMTASVVIP